MIRVNCVDYLLKKFFYKLGVCVAKYPGYFLIVPIFLTLICVTGLQRMHYVMDSEYLFSPTEGRYSKLIVIPKSGDNMLTTATWSELRLLDTIVKNITIEFGEEGEKQRLRYEDMCARWLDECFENDILNLDIMMGQIESGQLNLTFPVMINPVTWDAHVFSSFFGGTRVNGDIIEKVPSVQLLYFLTDDTKQEDEKGALWEDAFLNAISQAENNSLFQHISTARFVSKTLDIELEKNTRAVTPYFATTFAIMICFSVITSMMCDWVRSKPMLGLLGNLSAGMGTIAAFGLAVYCGNDFIGINLVAPFLTCSIGIDDTYVMLAAWRRTPVTMDVPERTGQMLSEAAVSITITSLTDIVSLWIGNKSPFPAIEIFCMYTGLAVTFILLWHVTFFTACVAIYGYIEQRNAHSITCIPVLPVSQARDRSWLYRIFCTGGINNKDPNNPDDNAENILMAWCRDFLGSALTKWGVKLLVMIIFGVYLAGAILGVKRIQEGLQRRKLSRPDSYSIEFYDREDLYFHEYPFRVQVLISGEIEYWNETVQNELEDLTKCFEKCEHISSSSFFTESWLRSFLGYVDRNKDMMNITIGTEEDFVSTLKQLWLFESNPFSLDVKFSEDGNKIIATRFLIQAINITSGTEIHMVRNLRSIAESSSFNVTVFHPYFLFFDQFELVRPTCIQQMLFGGIIMMIITFLFIPNFICSFWVAASIISIETGVIGYMALWDVNLDAISMVNLIMCIGFSVDFTAHICYAYVSSTADGTYNKTKESLYSLGLPVFQGAASTILGVSALLFVGSYIFLVFFKMIFLVTVIGALHGVFLLPVLLSLFSRKNPKNLKTDLRTYPSVYRIPSYPSIRPPQPPQPPPVNNVHHPKHFGVPLHGMVQGSLMNFYKAGGKYDGHDKDLGLGSSEDSSDASSFESQRRQQEHMQQKYMEGWRKSVMAGHRHGFSSEDGNCSNISMELMNRAKTSQNGFVHQTNYK